MEIVVNISEVEIKRVVEGIVAKEIGNTRDGWSDNGQIAAIIRRQVAQRLDGLDFGAQIEEALKRLAPVAIEEACMAKLERRIRDKMREMEKRGALPLFEGENGTR